MDPHLLLLQQWPKVEEVTAVKASFHTAGVQNPFIKYPCPTMSERPSNISSTILSNTNVLQLSPTCLAVLAPPRYRSPDRVSAHDCDTRKSASCPRLFKNLSVSPIFTGGGCLCHSLLSPRVMDLCEAVMIHLWTSISH